jgi:glucose/arabinose dehydrogenase
VKRTLLLPALCFAGCGAAGNSPTPTPDPSTCAAVAGTPPLTTTLVARGLDHPVDVQSVAADPSRLFIVEQAGRIRLLKGSTVASQAFLDISGKLGARGTEQGLLGLAFHPRYADTGRFFVNYTGPSGDTHIAEFTRSADPDAADPASERTLLVVDQPFANHNGGGLAFGPDGMLYIGLGDGGSGGDPLGNGQNLATPLGKMLRIDVDRSNPYAVPPDNPFVSRAGAFPAIWAHGLRNPWRFSFDRGSGDLVIGDVGQSRFEEIDLGLAARHGGENYGWNVTEGNHCYNPASGCATSGIVFPVVEYGHDLGCAVVGGIVYRGCRMPGYHGTYFFGDHCSAFIRSVRFAGGTASDLTDWTQALGHGIDSISSFGTDSAGEIYIVDYGDGELYKIVPTN